MGDLFLPESGKYLVLCPELINPDYFAAKFAAWLVVDEHPVAEEIPANGRAGGVDCADKTLATRMFPQKNAAFMGCAGILFVQIGEFFINFFGKFRQYMNLENLVRDTIPANVIPVIDLPLDFDELPKALAAFPTEVAFEFRHTSIRNLSDCS
jgi:hypothetical protein